MALNMEDREQKICYCKLCEQAERYDDMLEVINEVAKLDGGLSNEERNLLSVAYKNAISSRRASWRTLLSHFELLESEEEGPTKTANKKALETLLGKCEKELEDISGQILNLLDNHLIKTASIPETKVFYLKMKGDYWRYLAEFQKGDKRKKSTEESLAAYQEATKAAEELSPANTVRLGLSLNFSVFYYEVEKNREKACEIARAARDSANEDPMAPNQSNMRDRMLIIQLLEDNLNLWTSESKQAEGS